MIVMRMVAINFEIRLFIEKTSVKKIISNICATPVMIIDELYLRSRAKKLRFVLTGLSLHVQKLFRRKLLIIDISVEMIPARI